ncbi:PAS domain-containing protein [uncultured Algimonas sp.]|uniref:PAS domain-containing protein n=1 Tax=uncultured Algimonas sp. TaxID=1547920 RepID=UPI002620FBC2|nr:PAS domain-containing protein [uncultured Algimonas sp.]
MSAQKSTIHDGIDGGVAQAMLRQSPECVKLLDNTGELRFMSENGMTVMEIEDFDKVEGQMWWALWPTDLKETLKDAVDAARRGMGATFEAPCPTAQGTMKHWRVKVSAVKGGQLNGMIIASSRDITAEVAEREARRKLEEENCAMADNAQATVDGLRGDIARNQLLADLILSVCDSGQARDLKTYAKEIKDSAAAMLSKLSDLEASAA